MQRTVLEAARYERLRQKRRRANGERLLAIVNRRGVMEIYPPSEDIRDDWGWDIDAYNAALRRYHRNVADVKAAAKASPSRYEWTVIAHEGCTQCPGTFRIGLVRGTR